METYGKTGQTNSSVMDIDYITDTTSPNDTNVTNPDDMNPANPHDMNSTNPHDTNLANPNDMHLTLGDVMSSIHLDEPSPTHLDDSDASLAEEILNWTHMPVGQCLVSKLVSDASGDNPASTAASTAMDRQDSAVQDDTGFQVVQNRRKKRSAVDQSPDQTNQTNRDEPQAAATAALEERQIHDRNIHQVFGPNLPTLEHFKGDVGSVTGEMKFCLHSNGDVSAYQWNVKNCVWINIGHYSCAHKRIQGQLASERLKGETAQQMLLSNTLAYFRTVAKQREAIDLGLPWGPTQTSTLLPEPRKDQQPTAASKSTSADDGPHATSQADHKPSDSNTAKGLEAEAEASTSRRRQKKPSHRRSSKPASVEHTAPAHRVANLEPHSMQHLSPFCAHAGWPDKAIDPYRDPPMGGPRQNNGTPHGPYIPIRPVPIHVTPALLGPEQPPPGSTPVFSDSLIAATPLPPPGEMTTACMELVLPPSEFNPSIPQPVMRRKLFKIGETVQEPIMNHVNWRNVLRRSSSEPELKLTTAL